MREHRITVEDPIVCISVCMWVCARARVWTNLNAYLFISVTILPMHQKVWQTLYFYQLPKGICNLLTGPTRFSSLSEKARFSIYYPGIGILLHNFFNLWFNIMSRLISVHLTCYSIFHLQIILESKSKSETCLFEPESDVVTFYLLLSAHRNVSARFKCSFALLIFEILENILNNMTLSFSL